MSHSLKTFVRTVFLPDDVVVWNLLGQADARRLAMRTQRQARRILRRELLQAYEALCKAAGLKLHAITPRPFGTAVCLARQTGTSVPPVEGAAAVLTVAEQWAEFCVIRDNTLLLARSLSTTTTDPTPWSRIRAAAAATVSSAVAVTTGVLMISETSIVLFSLFLFVSPPRCKRTDRTQPSGPRCMTSAKMR